MWERIVLRLPHPPAVSIAYTAFWARVERGLVSSTNFSSVRAGRHRRVRLSHPPAVSLRNVSIMVTICVIQDVYNVVVGHYK